MDEQMTLYEAVGGTGFFDRLVDRFYVHVAARPDLMALYPDPDDLDGARWRLAMFLTQYWGGPTTYSDQRGHPRLRMRHAPFPIDEMGRDLWLEAMQAALDDLGVEGEVRVRLWDYFTMAAEAMRNR